jgi:uncharacterized protein YgiM (DUF1202 family)
MSGRFRYSLLVSLALIVAMPAFLRAQDSVQVQPDVANSRFMFAGVVNTGDVYVRSGPDDSYYATMRLPVGTPLTVVGIKNDWLKVVPPPGSFCYVSKLFIQSEGDGSFGRVTRADINVRAGSDQNALKTTVLGRLNSGDEIKILGQQDEYYKIAPPQGVYLYVNKQFVNPVKALGAAPATVDNTVTAAPSGATVATVADAATQPSPGEVVTTSNPTAPATQPAVAEAPPAPPQPSPAEIAETTFQTLESDFAAASQKPLEQQPVSDLAKRYDQMVKNTDLQPSERNTASFRLAVLNVRMDAQRRLAELDSMQTEAAKKAQSLKAEEDELQKRLDSHDVTVYTAVGTLRPSSLQYGAQTLYRLADPATGHTVIYLRGDNGAALNLLNQFVGVRGQVGTDDRIGVQLITFTDIAAVDPAQVNGKVVANIVPPSMAGHAVQASAGN